MPEISVASYICSFTQLTYNVLVFRYLTPLEKVISGLDGHKGNPSLAIIDSPGKGRGVTTKVKIHKGDFVVEYKTAEVYPRRQMSNHIEEYDRNEEGSYILEIQTKDGWFCLDATRAMGTMGRLLNHSSKPNIKPFRPLYLRKKWRVGFVALRDIYPGEEIMWDYGCPPDGLQWLYRRPSVEVRNV